MLTYISVAVRLSVLMALILHPSVFTRNHEFYRLFVRSKIYFPIPDTEFSHVTCFGQWTLAVVIQEEAWKPSDMSHSRSCAWPPLWGMSAQAFRRVKNKWLSRPSYPGKDHPSSVWAGWFPRHANRPGQGQGDHRDMSKAGWGLRLARTSWTLQTCKINTVIVCLWGFVVMLWSIIWATDN